MIGFILDMVCVEARVFKDMHATDTGYVLCCRPDHAVAGAFSPKIKFRRKKSLMEGDEECDPGREECV